MADRVVPLQGAEAGKRGGSGNGTAATWKGTINVRWHLCENWTPDMFGPLEFDITVAERGKDGATDA